MIASTEALDTHGTIIRQHWDLSRYDLNPVVLWMHNDFESSSWSMGGVVRPVDTLPIGRAEDVEVKGKKLKAKIIFGSAEYSELAQKVFLGCKEKIIRGVSVGFRPGSRLIVTNKDGSFKHAELGDEKNPNELIEISLLPLGSNPQAVARSIAREREHFSRMAAAIADGVGTESNVMNEQEMKEKIDAAERKAQAAETRATEAQARATKLEEELATERKLSEKLTGEVKTASERAAKAEAGVAKSELDKRQARKFQPSEREELDALVKDIGLERTLKIIDARGDLPQSKRALVDGKPLASTEQTAPEQSERAPGGASAALSQRAQEAASKAAS